MDIDHYQDHPHEPASQGIWTALLADASWNAKSLIAASIATVGGLASWIGGYRSLGSGMTIDLLSIEGKEKVLEVFPRRVRRFQTESKSLVIRRLASFIAQHSSFAYITPSPDLTSLLRLHPPTRKKN